MQLKHQWWLHVNMAGAVKCCLHCIDWWWQNWCDSMRFRVSIFFLLLFFALYFLLCFSAYGMYFVYVKLKQSKPCEQNLIEIPINCWLILYLPSSFRPIFNWVNHCKRCVSTCCRKSIKSKYVFNLFDCVHFASFFCLNRSFPYKQYHHTVKFIPRKYLSYSSPPVWIPKKSNYFQKGMRFFFLLRSRYYYLVVWLGEYWTDGTFVLIFLFFRKQKWKQIQWFEPLFI